MPDHFSGRNLSRQHKYGMDYQEFLRSDEWLDFRDEIWERHGGRCHICGAPGRDVHHLFYRYGLLNPRTVILTCRPCHLVWRGQDPVHLHDDNQYKAPLMRIAKIVRAIGIDQRWMWRGWQE
jgi:hypothetical protein